MALDNSSLGFKIERETLSQEEIIAITGCHRKASQIERPSQNFWVFFINKAGEPIVGTCYARLKVAGINPKSMAANNES